jgi:hypothetical protein
MDKNYSLLDEIKLKRREIAEHERLVKAAEEVDAQGRLQRKSELTPMDSRRYHKRNPQSSLSIKNRGAVKTHQELKIEKHKS